MVVLGAMSPQSSSSLSSRSASYFEWDLSRYHSDPLRHFQILHLKTCSFWGPGLPCTAKPKAYPGQATPGYCQNMCHTYPLAKVWQISWQNPCRRGLTRICLRFCSVVSYLLEDNPKIIDKMKFRESKRFHLYTGGAQIERFGPCPFDMPSSASVPAPGSAQKF